MRGQRRVIMRLMNFNTGKFQCRACGLVRYVKRQPDGRLPNGAWSCPNGCKMTPELRYE